MKKILSVVLVIAMVVVLCVSLTGCQSATKSLGGSMKIELEPNTKLELITWKDDSLWYLTRPMREDDIAETHTYKQKSEFGVFEGTVTIIETKENK